ncbi:MAG: hypothetical protein ACFFB0_02570 [Promethearchaeota archaeon]
MDDKLFRKTYLYICDNCHNFDHTEHQYCDKCGSEDSLRKAQKQDYKLYH